MSLYDIVRKDGKIVVIDLFTKKRVPRQEEEDVLQALKKEGEKKNSTRIRFPIFLN